MENVLRPVIVVGGTVVLTLLIGWGTDILLRKANGRHPETPLWGLLRRGRIPLPARPVRRHAERFLRRGRNSSRSIGSGSAGP